MSLHSEKQRPATHVARTISSHETIGGKPARLDKTAWPTRRRFRGTQVVWYALGVVEVLLAFRFILNLINANDSAGFTLLIESASLPLLLPFINVLPVTRFGVSVIEWSTLLAMLVYGLVAWAIVKIFVMSRPVSDAKADEKLEEQE